MKSLFKIILITTLLTINFAFGTITTMAQNVPNPKLDEKRGFRDLILGDPFSKWQTKIVFDNNTKGGFKVYHLTSTSEYTVYGKDVREIQLTFDKNTLIGISIITDFYQKMPKNQSEYDLYFPKIELTEISHIVSGLNKLFGNYNSISEADPNNGKGELFEYSWSGKCVKLWLSYCNEINNGSWASILILDTCKFKEKDPGF
jgi:hypothetical protein